MIQSALHKIRELCAKVSLPSFSELDRDEDAALMWSIIEYNRQNRFYRDNQVNRDQLDIDLYEAYYDHKFPLLKQAFAKVALEKLEKLENDVTKPLIEEMEMNASKDFLRELYSMIDLYDNSLDPDFHKEARDVHEIYVAYKELDIRL